MQRWSMTTKEEIQNFFFFSLWPMPYFLGNTKQNFPFMANPTTLKYSTNKFSFTTCLKTDWKVF